MDIFDSCLNLNPPPQAKEKSEDFLATASKFPETHIQEGHKDGYNAGLIQGKQDGYEVGLKHGFECGEEVGFYRGLADVWTSVIRVEPSFFSGRVKKSVEQLKELIDEYPFMDPEDESKDVVIDKMRLKFKAISATLGLKLEYKGYPKINGGLGRLVVNKMLKLMLACCKVYISESRNKAALESIERAVKLFPEARVINKFEDETYNRVGYTLVSKLPPKLSSDSCPLKDAVFAMVNSALSAINYDMHSGSHPRLGVVDHICFHPLANSSLEQTAYIARSLASDIGTALEVPTFLYGAAHEKGRTLDSIRRELGYFKPNTHCNIWAGGPNSESLPLSPDEGPNQVDRCKGVVVIGTTKWVDNYNVPIYSTNMLAARKLAKLVSERGGGLPSVQAMALAHGEEVIEVACNLLEPSQIGGDIVQDEVERLAQKEGLAAGKGYFTDFPQDKIIKTFLELGA